MKVAVVILNWNGAALLQQFVPSVLEHSKEANVYVIDNASTDNSTAILSEKFPEIDVIKLPENYGYAGGYNKGLAAIDADVYCLLNSDVKVSPQWLDSILNLFKNRSDIGIIQPKILDLKKPSHFEYAGAAGGYIDTLGYPFCRGRIFQELEEDTGQFNNEQSIFWATGACMFIRKTVFDALGGFDEHYFAHQEEIDLCWRAQNKE